MCNTYHPLSTSTPRLGDATFTRRRFLQSGLALVAATTTVPAFVARAGTAASAAAGRPGTPDGRVLVVVQLSGGNDGLNTVVPFGDAAYYRARPELGIAESQALRVGDGVGLHPSLREVHELMGEGLASVVQGVGYPNPNRSHFASMDIWHTADPEAGSRGQGWIGRALDSAEERIDPSLACVSIGSEAPLAAQGKVVKPVAFERTELFRWAAQEGDAELAQAYASLHDAPASAMTDGAASFVYRTALDAQVASDRVRRAVAQKSETPFPRNGLGQQLEVVAKMIRADLPTRVYYVNLGGFDTHANQVNRHAQLLSQFAQSMKAFYAELTATGHRSRVVTLAFSEFGRRVEQNGSAGTDHGAAGPLFVFGEAVRPGLLGKHPSLSDLDRGDLKFAVDFRSVYAELLDQWMAMDSVVALGRRFPRANIIRA